MDLEPYALTHAASASLITHTNTTTASPPLHNDKGKAKASGAEQQEAQQGVNSTVESTQAAAAEQPLPTIEEDVKQLVQGVSSWWTSFTEKSQAQFKQTQQHIASQGGIVSFAKKEASRLEAQLEETRRRVKEEREQEQERERELERRRRRKSQEQGTRSPHDEQPQQLRSVTEESKAEQTMKTGSRTLSKQLSHSVTDTEAGEGIFGSDEVQGSSQAASTKEDAQQSAPPSASQSPFALDATLFSRLQTLSSDPRVASIQQDLASRLSSSFSLLSHTIASATTSSTDDRDNASGSGSSGSVKEGPTTTASTSLSSTLQEISSTLAKVSGPEAKAYAQKYLKASEDLVGKMGEEVKAVVGELVKIVPPSSQLQTSPSSSSSSDVQVGEAATATSTEASASGSAKRPPLKQPSEVSSDFSSWDLTDTPHKTNVTGGGGGGAMTRGVESGTTTPSAFSSISGSGDHQSGTDSLLEEEEATTTTVPMTTSARPVVVSDTRVAGEKTVRGNEGEGGDQDGGGGDGDQGSGEDSDWE